MGVDRLANLRGAVGIKGLPALVIDGGSALTYTAVGCNGNIMGGGISPGFEMRMRAMNEFTCALPNVDVVKYLQEVGKMEVPPGIFAGDTERGMVVSLLNEVGCGLRGVVSAWKDDARVKDARKSPSAAGKKRKTASAGAGAAVAGKDVKELDNKDLLVTVTGGSGPTIVKLLKKDNGDILDFGAVPNPDISMQHILGLQHFGIAAVLCEKSKRDYTAPYVAEGNKEKQNEGSAAKKAKDAVKYDVYVGKRVAKEFEVPDEDGDHIYRGQVLSYSVYDGDKGIEPYFRVVYTDGDEEDVDFQDLKLMLEKFKSVGPKSIDADKNPEGYVGRRVAKTFFDDNQIYIGTIEKYADGLWYVEYDDGDAEDFEKDEVLAQTKFYEDHRHELPTES